MPGRDHCGKLNLLRTDAVWFTWNKKGEVSWDRRKNRLQKAICRRMRKRGVCFTNKRRKCTRPVGQKLNERGGKQFVASSFVTATGKTASKQRERQILWREDVLIVTVQIKSVLCVSLCLLLCLCVCVFFSGEKAHWIDVERIFVCSSNDLFPPIPRGSAYILLAAVLGGWGWGGKQSVPDSVFFWKFASFLRSCQTVSRIELKVTAIYCCSRWQNPRLNVEGDLDELLFLTLRSDDHVPLSRSIMWNVF